MHREEYLAPKEPRHEPVFMVPAIVLCLLAGYVAIHLLVTYLLSPEQRFHAIILYGFVPARISGALEATGLDGTGPDLSAYLTSVSYSLLHADWTHVLVNSVWMLAFGSVVAKRLNAFVFLTFCILASITGALAHYWVDPVSPVPMIGASAVVSGCMGAAVRFAFPQGARFSTDAHDQPLQSLSQCLRNPQVVAFVGVWFLINMAFGLGGEFVAGEGNAIAWQAHLGGFLLGLLCFGLFDRLSGRRATP